MSIFTRERQLPWFGKVRPNPKQPPLTREEIETVRAWSERGFPTSPQITLQLLATIEHKDHK